MTPDAGSLATLREVDPWGPMPGIRGWPILGNALELQRSPLDLLLRVARACGPIGRFRLGTQHALLVNSPELVHTVLVERPGDYDKGDLYLKVFRPILGQGLLTSEGDLHRQQRRMLAPMFTPRGVSRWADQIVALVKRRSDTWEDGQTFNAVDELGELAMEIASKVLLGTTFDDSKRMTRGVRDIFEWGMHTMTHPFALPLAVPTPINRRARSALDLLRGRIGGLVEQRWHDEEDRGDLLSLLLLARDDGGARMSRDQLYDELLTLCGAAMETTIGALSWSCYALATHPEPRRLLEREVDEVLDGRPPRFSDLPNLPYTLQAFQEALRVFPPASIITRESITDTEIGGYAVPKGTLVLISPYVLHRREDLYPDPERFEPERFERDKVREQPRASYIPFGIGPRMCIGNHFTLMEGQLVLATLAQRLRLDLLPEQEIVPVLQLNLRIKGDRMMVRVRYRRTDSGAAT